MRGDGKGGLYIDEPNGTANTVDSLDGRTWYKVVDVEAERVLQAPAYTRMTARIVADALSGQPISPFHFGGNGLAIDQSNALQNALEFTLLDDTNPQSCTLDLVGRNWRVSKALVIRDVPKTKRRITGGQLTAIGSYADEALLDIRPTANGGEGGSNSNWVNSLTIDHINILGGSSSGNVLVHDAIALKNAHGILIDSCYLQWFNHYGIIDHTDRAATETIVRNNRIVGSYGNSEGVRISGADAEICGKNIISNCRRGVVTLMHSVNVEYNHIYDCSEASIYYNDTAALCQGNYIDNAPIIIRNPRGLFTGNKFLRSLTTPMGEGSAFIVLFPRVPTLFVQGFNFQGNSFANTAGGQVKMFSVDESEGSIGAVYSSIINGNTVSSAVGTVLSQRSRPRGRVQISAGASGTLDLHSQLPFGKLKHAEVTWVKDPGSSVIPAAAVTNISAAGVVTVGLSQAATGLAYVSGDISELI
ncbi:right-handed parallel beta-helix repeat-containing protein [Pseudochrobactrum saccharolyticum]|nr:right-handed parallel beta-helix repeat-containing protein [Pseudochrobactrum saccharolyticum]